VDWLGRGEWPVCGPRPRLLDPDTGLGIGERGMHADASGARRAVGHPKDLDVGQFADREGKAPEEQTCVVGDADLAATTHHVLKIGLVFRG